MLVQRARFNKRHQLLGESVDAIIQDLYRLAEDCKYGSLKDSLIRDRIVVRVLDDTLSDRLQAKADLTLEQAVQMSRQSEARKESILILVQLPIRLALIWWRSTSLTKNQQRQAKPDQSLRENGFGAVDSSTNGNYALQKM